MALEQLDELFDYKNQLMEDLLTHKDIVALIDDTIELKTPRDLCIGRYFRMNISLKQSKKVKLLCAAMWIFKNRKPNIFTPYIICMGVYT